MKVKLPQSLVDKGIKEDSIVQQVQNEVSKSEFFTNSKRNLYKKRRNLYVNIQDQDTKIYSRLIFSVLETLLALYVKTKPNIVFKIMGEFFDEVERNIKRVSEADYVSMDMEEKKERTQFNKFFYGVGIEVLDGFDPQEKQPDYLVVSPMQWICDPEQGINNKAQFHWFELRVNPGELTKEWGYFNLDQLVEGDDTLTKEDREETQQHRYLNSNYGEGCTFNIYHHYTILGGRKYLVTLGNDKTLLLRVQEIEPVTKKEKDNPALIEFPVIVRNWVACDRDPWGISICDIMEDKQTMQQLFLNLNRIKAENEARGDIFLYDPNIIENIDDIKIPDVGPKYIKATWLNGWGTPMIEVPRGQIKSDAYNMPDIIKQQGFLDLGLDERSLGISGDTSITATENQRVQANANLRQLLGFKRDSRAERKFRLYWYRRYQECFYGKKKIRVEGDYGDQYFEFNTGDFIVYESVDVKIRTVQEIEEEDEKRLLQMLAMREAFLNDQTKSRLAKASFERELYRLQKFGRDKISIWVEESYEEMQAKEDIEFLNRDQEPAAIENLNEDHQTYIQVYRRAKDTSAKEKAIAARLQALMASKRSAMLQPQQVQGGGQMQGQIVSSLMSQANSQNNQAKSLDTMT